MVPNNLLVIVSKYSRTETAHLSLDKYYWHGDALVRIVLPNLFAVVKQANACQTRNGKKPHATYRPNALLTATHSKG